MLPFRNSKKVHVNLIATIVLMVVFVGAFVQSKPASASGATWNPSLGWDFESHSNIHPSFISLTASQMRAELDAVKASFAAHGYSAPQHFAYPYGDYDDTVEQVVSQYYLSARTVSDNMTTYPVTNWYEINSAQLVSTTTWNDIVGWTSKCIAQKALLIIFTHDVSATPSAYGCTPQMLTRLLDYLVQQQNAGNLTVMTMAQAYDYWSTAKVGKPTVVISFDDSNESDYTVVYPLFKARGLKGTSFLVTSVIDEDGQLSWNEIAKMRASSTTYTVQLQSKQNSSSTTNLGTITFSNTLYSLPTNLSIPSGNYQAQYSPAKGYAFDHWQTTGNITVTNSTADPTTANVTGAGTLTVVYKASTGSAGFQQYVVLKAAFHLHTSYSGGTCPPAQLVDQYAALGYNCVSITDYNSIDGSWAGVAEAKAEGLRKNVTVIGGEEIISQFPLQNGQVVWKHILALFLTSPITNPSQTYRTNNVQYYFDAIHAQRGLGFVAHSWMLNDAVTVGTSNSPWWQFRTSTFIDGWEAFNYAFPGGMTNTEITNVLGQGRTILDTHDTHGGAIQAKEYTLLFCLNNTEAGIKDALLNQRTVAYHYGNVYGTQQALNLYNVLVKT